MKASALFHLMQLRAKKLQEYLTSEEITTLNEIQKSLYVEKRPGEYFLQWELNNKQYQHCIDDDTFKFYKKGDSSKNLKNTDVDLRKANWSAALNLWQQLYKLSNLNHEKLLDDGKLSFDGRKSESKNNDIYENLLISTVVALPFIYESFSKIAVIFFAILPVLVFAQQFRKVHLRHEIRLVEKIIIALGVLLPAAFHINYQAHIFTICAIVFLCFAERSKSYHIVSFIMAGVLIGLGIGFNLYYSISLFIIFFIGMLLISIIDSARMHYLSGVYVLAGMITVVLISYKLHGDINYFKDGTYLTVVNMKGYSVTIVTCITVLSISFMSFWVTGVQYYLLPWLSLLAITVATSVTYNFNIYYALEVLFPLCGFTIIIFFRIINSFFYSNIKTEKQI